MKQKWLGPFEKGIKDSAVPILMRKTNQLTRRLRLKEDALGKWKLETEQLVTKVVCKDLPQIWRNEFRKAQNEIRLTSQEKCNKKCFFKTVVTKRRQKKWWAHYLLQMEKYKELLFASIFIFKGGERRKGINTTWEGQLRSGKRSS